MFKRTVGNDVLHKEQMIFADLGYLGINGFHENSVIPQKSSKLHELSAAEKIYNQWIAQKRVVIEHINAKIKVFKCMTYPYRNHCKRHLLRTSLICGIINYER